jgi:glucosamine--fructose-6-phosphate aminotransferase (isomerizing)
LTSDDIHEETPVPASEPGHQMLAEIQEQPRRVHDALSAALPHVDRLAAAVAGARLVVFLGRGSSRSSATYGARALHVLAGRPALVASPAELAWGDWSLPLDDALVIAVSQSGESREMVAAAEQARARGARLLVVTNTPTSTLAGLAEDPGDVLDCVAGAEVAVPATKSFTTSLACLLAIAGAGRPDELARARDELPGLIQDVLTDPRAAGLDLSGLDGFSLAGEGFGEAVAEEGAIKLRETLVLPCASFETSEFLHGSINSSSAGLGVITVETGALSLGLARDVVRGARERGATTVHIGETGVDGADQWVHLPSVPAPWSAFLAVLPIQLAARSAALARGLDPDRPEGLTKVTLIDFAAG